MKVLSFRFRLKEDARDNARAVQELIGTARTPSLPDLSVTPLVNSLSRSEIAGIVVSGDPEAVAMTSDRIRHLLQQQHVVFDEEESLAVDPSPGDPGDELKPVEGYSGVFRQGEHGFSRVVSGTDATERGRWNLERAMRSGIRFFHLGMYADAVRRLKEAIDAGQATAEAYHFLGLVYEQMGQLDSAAEALRAALEKDKDSAASWFYLANVLQRQGLLEEAIETYKKAIELDPEVPIVYNNMGWVFYQMGEHEKAVRAFEESISIDPELPFAHNGLACVYQDTGNLPEAVEEFKAAIEQYPEYAAAHLKLGWAYLLMGDVPSAVEALKNAALAADDPQYSVSAHYSLGHAYLSQNQVEMAADEFQQVLAMDADFSDARFHAAEAMLRLSRYDEALPLLLESLAHTEEHKVETHKLLAVAYFHLRKFRDAGREARVVLKMEPDEAEAVELLGNIAVARGRWAEAEKIFRKALQLNPASAFSHFQMGWIAENTERKTEAIEHYKKAIQIDAEATEAYNNLGWLYTEQGKTEEALVIFEKAVEINPDDEDLINNLAWTYALLGKNDEAVTQYRAGIAKNPTSSLLNGNLGTILYRQGRNDEAQQYLEKSLRLPGDNADRAVAHYYLGLLNRRLGHMDKALHHFLESIQSDPEYAEPWFPLGECLAQLGKRQKADHALRQYLKLSPKGEFAARASEMLESRRKAAS
ncbi:MAG: tetratricopeptide repeat protein [Candidatus Xenobia bacterium]